MIQGFSQNLPRPEVQQKNEKNHSQSLKRPQTQSTEPQEAKSQLLLYINLRKSFLIFSHIHDICNLRHQTMFLAYQIYTKTIFSDRFKHHIDRELQCVSIFLAMKYEEIYPPTLKHLNETMDWDFSRKKYIAVESKVIEALNGSLAISTMCEELRVSMERLDIISEMFGLYLLELSVMTKEIFPRFPREKIIEAIVTILQEQPPQSVSPTILTLVRLILQVRVQAYKKLPSIYKKYRDKRYHSVSDLTLVNPRKPNSLHD